MEKYFNTSFFRGRTVVYSLIVDPGLAVTDEMNIASMIKKPVSTKSRYYHPVKPLKIPPGFSFHSPLHSGIGGGGG